MDTKYRKTLWIKTAMTMIGFAIVPLLALGITVYYYFDPAYEKKIMDTLRASTLDTGNTVQSFLNELASQLFIIGETYSQNRLNNRANLDDILSNVKSVSTPFVAIEIVGSGGNRIEYAGPRDNMLEAFNKGAADWYRKTMSSGVYVSDVVTDSRNTRCFFIAVALGHENRWALRAMVEAKGIDGIVERAQKGEKSCAFIVNKSSGLQTAPPPGDTDLQLPDATLLALPTGTHVAQINYQGKASFVAVTHLENPPWVLVTTEDYREQMAPLLSARYTESLIVVCGFLLILGGTILTVRSVVRHSAYQAGPRREYANESATQSGKMVALGRMAAGIAHEVNNPLAVIGGMAGWMKDLLDEQDIRASRNFETYRDCITKIEGEVRRCKIVTHRLLSFGRGIKRDTQAIDVNHLLAEVISLLESEAYFRDIAMRVAYGNGLPQLTTDPAKLQQLFFEVLDKSIDALGKIGTIDVKTGYAAKTGEILVQIARMSSPSPSIAGGEATEDMTGVDASQNGTVAEISADRSVLEKLGGRITVTETAAGHIIYAISLPAPSVTAA